MHDAEVLDVEWLPDSNTVLTAGMDEMVSMYDVERDLVQSAALARLRADRRRPHVPASGEFR